MPELVQMFISLNNFFEEDWLALSVINWSDGRSDRQNACNSDRGREGVNYGSVHGS